MSEQFLDLVSKADPAQSGQAEVLLDTNVMLEIYSIADLLRVADECGTAEVALRSPRFKYRQLRARHSVVLAWWLGKQGKMAGILGNEVVDQLEKLAPLVSAGEDGTSYIMTTAIVHIVVPHIARTRIGALMGVNQKAQKTGADTEILLVAHAENLPLVTNEGLQETGIAEDRGLRKRAKEFGVRVFTPKEFLDANGVDVAEECRRFVDAIPAGIREAQASKAGKLLNGHSVVDDLESIYRFVLLDDVDRQFAHIKRPP